MNKCPSRSNPYDEESPCEVCWGLGRECVCEACLECGEVGNPECINVHGMAAPAEVITALRRDESRLHAKIEELKAELELERRDHQELINVLENDTIRRYNEDCDEEKWLLSVCIDIDDDCIETWTHPVFESLEGAFKTYLVERFDKAMKEE